MAKSALQFQAAPGDRLLKIDGRGVRGEPIGRVMHWLGGKPGDMRALAVLREGKPATGDATVREVF